MADASPYHEDKITDPATGRQKITRNIEENGHPVLSQAVFIQYATARVEAAKSLLKKENKESPELNQLSDYIKDYFSQEDDIKEEDKFKKAKNQKPLDKEQYNTAFNAYYKYNIKKCQKINRLLVHYLNPEVRDKKQFKAVMKKIEAECSNLKAETERPIQENHYNALDLEVTSSHIPEGKFNKFQEALYTKLHKKTDQKSPEDRVYTTPSTIRDERQIGQVNALQTEIKIGDKVVFSGHRHGSPCPYKIEDDAERQYRTLQNIKQTMAIAAKEKIAALTKEQTELKKKNPKNEPENPRLTELTAILDTKTKALTLDISSMSLLSPVNDTVLDKSDKQVRQVNDSRLAYWSLQGREIPLDIPGKPGFTVNLNSTFMTMGVNAARGIEGPEAAALIKRVNNRGLNNLIENFIKDLSSNASDSNAIESTIKMIDNYPDIKACKDAIKNFDYTKLHQAYANLDDISQNLSNSSASEKIKKEEIKKREAILKTIDEQERRREATLKTIDEQERILDTHHEALANARKAAYKNALPKFQAELKELANQNIDPPFLLKTRLFVNALDTFYNQPQVGIGRAAKQKISKRFEDHTRNKGNYEFQSQFALLAHKRGEFVEWFCKSGEDRTGLLNEYIEAYCIFIGKNGRPPIWDNPDDEKALQAIMPHVHNGAPNRESNGFNDDSPGLKVSNADINLSRAQLDYTQDKQVGEIKDKAGLKIKKNI